MLRIHNSDPPAFTYVCINYDKRGFTEGLKMGPIISESPGSHAAQQTTQQKECNLRTREN